MYQLMLLHPTLRAILGGTAHKGALDLLSGRGIHAPAHAIEVMTLDSLPRAIDIASGHTNNVHASIIARSQSTHCVHIDH